VNEAAVTATPLDRRPWISTGSMSRGVAQADFVPAHLSGEELIKQLQEAPASEYLVVEPDGSLLGVLTASDVAAALQR
jgi:CBS domain containing-hemolysin-like protein